MRIEAGALKVDAEGLNPVVTALVFVLVHILGPILWVFSWIAYHIRGGPRE